MESSTAAKAVRGVSSEGFMTTVQPHARAGPTWYIRKQITPKMIVIPRLLKTLKKVKMGKFRRVKIQN